MNDHLGKPEFINEIGAKWWRCPSLFRYAQSKLGPDYQVWIVEAPDGYTTRILIENGEPIKEATGLEAMSCFIDFLKLVPVDTK